MDEIRVSLYNFSGNYDCSTCGRVNCPFAVNIVTAWLHENLAFNRIVPNDYCSGCVWELTGPEERVAYIDAAYRVGETTKDKV